MEDARLQLERYYVGTEKAIAAAVGADAAAKIVAEVKDVINKRTSAAVLAGEVAGSA